MSDFKTEKEIWQWLLESDNHRIKWNGEEEEAGGGSNRVKQGGSWYSSNAESLRAASRNSVISPGNRISYLGFRCAQLWDYLWKRPATLVIEDPTVWKKVVIKDE